MIKKLLRKVKILPEPLVQVADQQAEKAVRKALPKLLKGIGKLIK